MVNPNWYFVRCCPSTYPRSSWGSRYRDKSIPWRSSPEAKPIMLTTCLDVLVFAENRDRTRQWAALAQCVRVTPFPESLDKAVEDQALYVSPLFPDSRQTDNVHALHLATPGSNLPTVAAWPSLLKPSATPPAFAVSRALRQCRKKIKLPRQGTV